MTKSAAQSSPRHTRRLTVLAQDPGVLRGGKALTTQVEVPAGTIFDGPRNSRLQTVDYDSTADKFYGVHKIGDEDLYADETNIDRLVGDPIFHAQNVFGVVASTILEFERALGRKLSWGFDYGSHQLKLFPHAFVEANAYYSRADECLAFGYFPKPGSRSKYVYTCLSHDVIAHETTHAILDGLRTELMRPSGPDQAAFHEGFADIVALLKILKSEHLVDFMVRKVISESETGLVCVKKALDIIEDGGFLYGLADEMGQALEGMGRSALREYRDLKPDPSLLDQERYQAPHLRGEVLVGAVMKSFQTVWKNRVDGKLKLRSKDKKPTHVQSWRIAEEGAKAAGHLLTMMIRAVDYLPPVNVSFGDFLSAALTADWQIFPQDRRTQYRYRDVLIECFAAYGITPAATGTTEEPGVWDSGTRTPDLTFNTSNMDEMRWNPEAMYGFIWENSDALGILRDVFTRVNSVRPVWRIGPGGFILQETVAEYYQLLKVATLADFRNLNIEPPEGLERGDAVQLVAGGSLIFDEFGRLKFHIHNRIARSDKAKSGKRMVNSVTVIPVDSKPLDSFSEFHRIRAFGTQQNQEEEWSQ